MDLKEGYQALVRGAMLVAESAEDAYRLGALDRFLKPWVRGRLHSLGGLLDSCDTRRQLAEDTRVLAQTAAEYSELRNQLFSDVHHTRPEPPWRVVGQRTMAIRAQSGVLLRQPTYILRRLDADSDVPGAATWDFTVIDNPSDPADEGTSFVVMVSTSDQPGGVPVQVSKELEGERAWYQQLEYGFYALGITPFLTAIYGPDRHRRPATGDGLTS
ncbi:hypothetical protein AQI95_39840 [Streptomyces yokosukanensis]|uniref:Uncharacterized protein n=1 Tax=Streptomyces yokosukanensis TaxID=67386 RepID=A0A101NTT0_9ACTN|nr:hypothetical protein [Streptomyces yokosukanensis]KUM99195.1 hypothetical protein AQI95_39840 [Streptomyces yokosukanensis]